MEAHPRVSIITTTFDAASYIEEMLDAAERLDWPNLEFVVVDDGSTDNTAELLQRRANENDRIRPIFPGRVGRARALNMGSSAATGEFIAINDVDDLSLPDRIRKQVSILSDHPEAAAVAADYLKVDKEGPLSLSGQEVLSSHGSGIREVTPRNLYRTNYIAHSTVMFRKASWASCGGYNEEMSSCIDYDFYFRLTSIGKFIFTEDILLILRTSPNSLFKKMTPFRYFNDYRTALATGRKRNTIPLRDRIYDLKPAWFALKKFLGR